MNNLLRKIAIGSVILGLGLTALPAFGAISAGCRADLSTCTTAELTEYIAELSATLTALQAQLSAQTTPTTPTAGYEGIPADFTFTKNLSLGMKDADVVNLKIVLAAEDCVSGLANTNYFGSKTLEGVKCFQNKYKDDISAAAGYTISASGFVGTGTRTKLNALLAGGLPAGCNCTAWVDGACGTGDNAGKRQQTRTCTPAACAAESQYVTDATCVVTAGLTVALAADTPVSGTLVAGQSIAPLARFVFTNGDAAEVKITTLKLKRLGVSGDTTLSKVYLYDGVNRLGDEAVVSTGVISWNNTAGVIVIPANNSKTIEVKSDILTGTAGQTVGVGIIAATDITSNASAVNGTFPINGNTMSIALATLAGVSFANSAATTPSANTSLEPQTDFVMFQNSVTIGTRAVNLKSITFRNIGSVDKATDLKNFKFYIDGVQVGSTVEKSDADGYITFDLSASPKKIETGTRVFKVVGDVIGGSTKTFQISLRKAADVNVTDSEYGANILIQVASATFTVVEAGQQTVSTGSLIITKRTDSPTGNVVNNGTGVTLAKYDLKAYGESIKIENLRVSITASTNNVSYLRNGALFADGIQVGSTANLNEDSQTVGYTEFALGSSLIVVPGVTKVLEVRADIYDNDGTNDVAAGVTLKANIVGGSSNCQRMVSGGYFANTAETTASTLTVATGALTASIDQSYGSQTVVVPQSNYLLGKFSVSAGPTEDVNMHTITVDFTFADEFGAADLTNVYVKYGTKTTSLKSTVSATAGANTWSISEALTKNTSLTFEVYGDIAAAAVVTETTADTVLTKLKLTGTTAQSGTTVYSGAAGADATVNGQTITAGSAGVLTVTLDSGTPLASQVVAGSTPGNGSVKVKLAATKEDIYVKDLTFRVNTNANDVAIQSLTLFAAQGSGSYAQVGSAVTLNTDSTNPGYVRWILDGANRIKVAKNGSTYLLVKPTYVSSGQATVTSLTPRIMLADLQAEGVSVLTAGGAGTDLINSTGIVVRANLTTAAGNTYVASGDTVNDATISTTDTTFTVTNNTAFAPGDVIFVDLANDDGFFGSEELMVVLADGGTTLTVQRGAFGTTPVVHATASLINGNIIYRLSGVVGTYANAGIIGNQMTVLNTKLALALGTDSPSGATAGGTGRIVFTFTASAENNAADPAENKAVLTRIDITNTESASSVNDLKIYPSEYDQDANYVTTCGGLTASKWRCIMSTTGSSNEVVENTTRKYIVRGNTAYNANGNIQVSIATLGTADATTNSVSWTDGATTMVWVNQSTSAVEGGIQSSTVQSGTVDATAPTITAIAMGNGGVLNDIDANDTITITYSEVIDPTTVNASLVPGGSVTGVTSGTGVVTVAQATAIVTVGAVTTFDSGASVAVAVSATTQTLALDATGKILTITITALTGGGTITTPAPGVGAQIAGVYDVNGNNSGTPATPTPTGAF